MKKEFEKMHELLGSINDLNESKWRIHYIKM